MLMKHMPEISPLSGDIILPPSQILHFGVVARDIDLAMQEMSDNLGVSWTDPSPVVVDIILYGQERTLEMRVAHSLQGPPHMELIEAVPDSPWALPEATGVHHICYWSDDSVAVCQSLEQRGNRRVMGMSGSDAGYFLSPSGMYIEIVPRELRDNLTQWIQQSLAPAGSVPDETPKAARPPR